MLFPLGTTGSLKNVGFVFKKQVLSKVVAEFPIIGKTVNK